MSGSSTSEDDTSSFEGEKVYRRGGFHAAYVGETLGPKRVWRVVSKLGFGVHATAWAVCSSAASRGTKGTHAVKIHRADGESWRDEVDTLMQMRGDGGILRIATSFEHRGPNGAHGCIVTELEGCSVDTAVRARFAAGRADAAAGAVGAVGQLPAWLVLGIARDMLTGLAALHARGFVHTDVKPDNVLLRPALSRLIVGAAPELRIFSRNTNAKPKNKKPQAPMAVGAIGAIGAIGAVIGADAERDTKPGQFCVIGDLGNAEAIRQYPPEPGTIQPRLYRAPEVVAFLPHTEAVDVYSAGAVVHYAATGAPLLDPEGESSEDRNADHARLIARTLGPFPEYMRLASFVARKADGVEFDPSALAPSPVEWLVRLLTTVDPHERPTAAAAAAAQSPAMVE